MVYSPPRSPGNPGVELIICAEGPPWKFSRNSKAVVALVLALITSHVNIIDASQLQKIKQTASN